MKDRAVRKITIASLSPATLSLRLRRRAILAVGGLGLVTWARRAIAQTLPVRVERWLEVRSLAGTVQFTRQSSAQPARVGFRLQSVGEGLRTSHQSQAILALDTEVGFVSLASNTELRIENLSATASGGRITYLRILRGQARLQTRPFTNPDTRLDVETPAGVASIRGTVYGLTVQPDGRTGIATLEGVVVATGAGQSVTLNPDFQTLIVPGQPPTPPSPITNDVSLDLRSLRAIGGNQVELVGRVDPLNILVIDNQVQTLERTGQFSLQLPLPTDRQLTAIVTTPLGNQQIYALRVP